MSHIAMKSIRDLKKAVDQGKKLIVYPDAVIDNIDVESYNSRRKTIIVNVKSWGGWVSVKIKHIRQVSQD